MTLKWILWYSCAYCTRKRNNYVFFKVRKTKKFKTTAFSKIIWNHYSIICRHFFINLQPINLQSILLHSRCINNQQIRQWHINGQICFVKNINTSNHSSLNFTSITNEFYFADYYFMLHIISKQAKILWKWVARICGRQSILLIRKRTKVKSFCGLFSHNLKRQIYSSQGIPQRVRTLIKPTLIKFLISIKCRSRKFIHSIKNLSFHS